jgi:hypothetical protein
MQSHICSTSTEHWCIIKEGFKPYNPDNLNRREVVGDKLNATALHIIHLVVTSKDRAHIRSCKTAKQAWNKLDDLFLGNKCIQSSKFDEVNTSADGFVMNGGESAQDMYWRLTTLTVQMRELGASHADDKWVKRKFYNALFPYEEQRLNSIRQNSDYLLMTSNEVLSEIVAMDISKKNADELVVRARNSHKSNLALKAKVSEESESDEEPMNLDTKEIKYSYHKHVVLPAKKFWGGNKARGPRSRDYSPRDYSPRDSPRDNARYSL